VCCARPKVLHPLSGELRNQVWVLHSHSPWTSDGRCMSSLRLDRGRGKWQKCHCMTGICQGVNECFFGPASQTPIDLEPAPQRTGPDPGPTSTNRQRGSCSATKIWPGQMGRYDSRLRKGKAVRLSDLAKTAIVGATLGGAAFAPLALLNTQTAGATPENQIRLVLTTDPELYIHQDQALCVPLDPQFHTFACVFRSRSGGSQPQP
jgi:hypothetical protein